MIHGSIDLITKQRGNAIYLWKENKVVCSVSNISRASSPYISNAIFKS